MTPEEFTKREMEISQAVKEFPVLEIGEAYRKWKENREETASFLNTGDPTIEIAKKLLREGAKKPCTQEGCSGTMELEPICAGCVEGRLGWKTKWTCDVCLFREFSKKDYMEWLSEFSSSLKD